MRDILLDVIIKGFIRTSSRLGVPLNTYIGALWAGLHSW